MADIYAQLTEIFHDVFEDDDIRLAPDMALADINGWDSSRMILVVVGVEERFGIRIAARELDDLVTVGDLARLVGAKARAA